MQHSFVLRVKRYCNCVVAIRWPTTSWREARLLQRMSPVALLLSNMVARRPFGPQQSPLQRLVSCFINRRRLGLVTPNLCQLCWNARPSTISSQRRLLWVCFLHDFTSFKHLYHNKEHAGSCFLTSLPSTSWNFFLLGHIILACKYSCKSTSQQLAELKAGKFIIT